jgi:hypothetical protein
MTQGRYAVAILGRIGLLVAATLAFPYFVWLMVEASGARRVGGAGGALAVVLSVYVKPVLYLLFAASMLRPVMRRAATLGMSAALGLGVVALVLGDLGFGIAFGAHWGAGFVMGILKVSAPWFLLGALIASVTLGLLLAHDDDGSAAQRLGVAYRVWLTLFCVLAATAALAVSPAILVLLMGKGASPLLTELGKLLAVLRYLPPMYLVGLFAIASVWLVVVDRSGGAPKETARRPPGRSPSSPSATRGPGGGVAFGSRAA